MNFIIRLHRLYLSFVGKWKVVFKLRDAEERQGCLWNSQSHRFRIFLIIKMSGYEKCQNMSSPSSGACLAGLIKSSGCYNKIWPFCLSCDPWQNKEKERGSNIWLLSFCTYFLFWHILFGCLWGNKWRRMSWKIRRLKAGGWQQQAVFAHHNYKAAASLLQLKTISFLTLY